MRDEGLEILQNIQDQTQCKKLKSYGDELSRITKDPIGDGVNSSRFNEEEDGLSPEDLSNLNDAQGIASELQNIESDDGMNDRTFKILSK